jgi:RNA polymerase sigma-70 factor (ECF subfamily)
MTAVLLSARTIRFVVERDDMPEVRRTVSSHGRDRELAGKLAAGDETALRSAYREFSRAVFGLALRVIGNDALAEEVTQDVFVRLWQHPERFDPARGTMRSFLLAMTHSRAVERVRAEESMRRRHESAQRQPVESVDDPSTTMVQHETRHAVRAALAALPEDQRVPIELAYYEGLSYREVAVRLEEPEGTVKYRIRMGMQKMRAALRAVEVAP